VKLILAKSELLDVKGFYVWMHSCEKLNDKYRLFPSKKKI